MVYRSGEQVTLGALTAEVSEQIQLGLRFHPLGDYFQAQMVGKHYYDSYDFVSLGVAVHARDENPVYLQSIDTEALQAAERRVASAKVVDV